MSRVSPVNPLSALDTAAWRRHAACADTDPELFFATDEETVGQAKQVCATCPVRTACLETALRQHEMHGVWGGMAEAERRRLIRQRRREQRERRARAKQRQAPDAA